MAKPSTDGRSSKTKRVTFANVKAKRIPCENGKSNASANSSVNTSSTRVEPNVAFTNGQRDSATTASEQRPMYPTSIFSATGDVPVLTPNPAFVENDDALEVNPNPNSTASGDVHVSSPNPAQVATEEVCVMHDRDAANFQLAIYIAMAHAGLVLAIAICYGVGLLLKDYWTPIQWAVLISMPLHRVQETVVKFWMRHLERGLVQTIVTVPAELFSAWVETAGDVHTTFRSLLEGRGAETSEDNVTFWTLCDWLFSLGTCTLMYENLGLVYTVAVACFGFAIYWSINGLHSVVTAAFPDLVFHAQERRRSASRLLDFTRWSNQGLAQFLARNLPSLVALGLIVSMILGVVGGTLLFSFKVGVEAKDVVVALKLKMENMENNKFEGSFGFSNWLEPKSAESHMMSAYAAVVQKVDEYAERNNMTVVANTAKEFLKAIASSASNDSVGNSTTLDKSSYWERFMTIFQILKEKFEKRELRQALKNLVKSGEGFMTGAFYVLVVLGSIVANFIKQLIVFVFVLFFLITSEAGGVMEQALEVIPLSQVTRQKCAAVLDRTISAVLLTTGKLMFFQALFTYLFFRFLKIHFLYMSTCIALVQGMMPVFPNWMASLPALLQLLAERKYVLGLFTVFIYKYVIDYGLLKIQGVVSNYNQYLSSLSMAGAMTLFQPAICGVIMGPLILTVLVAIRDLYCEFVLEVFTNYQRI